MTVLRRADGRETTLHADRTTLGYAPSCDVVLDDPAVAPRHASILRTDRGWLLVDESGGAGVQVDGVAVANHFLRDGETLRLGATELSFSDRGATLHGTPRPQLRPALELEGLRGVPVGAPPSSTPTTPGTRAPSPSSTPTLEGRAAPSETPTRAGGTEVARTAAAPTPAVDDTASSSDIALAPSVPIVSGATVRAPIAPPPPFAGAAVDDVPRATASIYEPPTARPDPDDRPFVDGATSRRAASVYTMGDEGPRASLDPVVDVYTLGRPGAQAGSSRSVYSIGTAPTHPGAGPSESAAYSIGEAETMLPPGGGRAPAHASRDTFSMGRPPTPSSASVYSLGEGRGPAPAHRPAPAAHAPPRELDRRPGESWSWVQPEPDRGRRAASALGRPGRGLITAGLVLVVLGLVLVAVAFGLGLTIDDVRGALAGGR